MARKRKKPSEQSIFELLSDLSLSTLGLFLIIFVIYAIIFNSQGYQVAEILQENKKLTDENEELQEEDQRLRNKVTQLENDLTVAEELAQSAAEKLEIAESQLEEEVSKNRYVGFYKGDGQGNRHGGDCSYVAYKIPEKYEVFFLNNTVIVNQITSGTILSYRATGSLNGSSFKGDSLIVSRADGETIYSCARDSVNLIFQDGGVQLYIPGELDDEGVFLKSS